VSIAIVAISLALFAICAAVEVTVPDVNTAIPNQYVITLHEDTTDEQRNSHIKALIDNFQNDGFDNEFLGSFQIGKFQGFSARLSQRILQIEQASSSVVFIEQDSVFKSSQACSSQNGATWGIDRIAEQAIDLDGQYRYPSTAGNGVDAYVIDTGINIKHTDFGGRAIWGANYVDSNNVDCNGHGTHVAGTIGGTVYGVAKKATLIAVKVLGCDGSGSTSGIVNSISWVVSSKNSRKRPSVANMSLGGSLSTSLNNAVNSAVSSGVTMVVASGNENQNSCNVSPASATSAISVGATGVDEEGVNQVDSRAYFSNYGKCTHIFAPGLMITSTWIGSRNNEIDTISGTSMASPHVAGAVAVYLGNNPTATPAAVKSWVVNGATNNEIRLDCSGALSVSSCNQSPNKLLYSPC